MDKTSTQPFMGQFLAQCQRALPPGFIDSVRDGFDSPHIGSRSVALVEARDADQLMTAASLAAVVGRPTVITIAGTELTLADVRQAMLNWAEASAERAGLSFVVPRAMRGEAYSVAAELAGMGAVVGVYSRMDFHYAIQDAAQEWELAPNKAH